MKITKIYDGKKERQKAEEKLFAEGWQIESEEEVKDWDAGKACCLAFIFLPLIFFGKTKKIKVIYFK